MKWNARIAKTIMNGLNKLILLSSFDWNLLYTEIRKNWFDGSSLLEASCKNKVVKAFSDSTYDDVLKFHS